MPYHESDHVLNLAYNALCNGTCLDDIELRRNDAVFLDALGSDRIPDSTTAGDFCRRFFPDDVEALQAVFDLTRLKVWKEQPREFFDEAILPDGRSMNREMVRRGLAWCVATMLPPITSTRGSKTRCGRRDEGYGASRSRCRPGFGGEAAPQTAGVVGNRRSRVYHKPICRGMAAMIDKNRVTFANEAEAEKAGYRPAGDCR